jgi:hypothetical protein
MAGLFTGELFRLGATPLFIISALAPGKRGNAMFADALSAFHS